MTDWIDHFPEFISLLFVLAAVFFAFLVRKGLVQLLPWINRVSLRLGSKSGSMLSPEFGRILQVVFFWGIILAGIVLALSVLGTGELSQWLDRIWSFVAHLLVALGILAVGHVLGSLARTFLTGFSHKHELAALPRMAYAVVMGATALVVFSHLGLDISFITQLVLVFVAVFLAGLALSFALGARSLVANLSAGGDLAHYKTNDRLRIEGVEGTVVEIQRTAIVLSTEEGLARIPARKFAESTVVLLRREEDDG